MNQEKKGFWYMLAYSFFMALSYIIADMGFRFFDLSVANLSFWSFFGALFFSTPFFLGKQKRRKSIKICLKNHWIFLILTSALTAFVAILWFWALSHSNSGILSLLDKSEILWAILLGVLFLGENISKKEILILLLPISGLILISQLKGEITLLTTFTTLFVSFVYAFQSFLVKKYLPQIDGFSFSFLRACFIFFFLGLFFLFQGSITLIPLSAFFLIGIGEASGLLIARIFYFNAHKYLDISRLNIFQMFIPFFALIGSIFLFPDVTLSPQKIGGALLIIGGILLFLREHFQKKEGDLP